MVTLEDYENYLRLVRDSKLEKADGLPVMPLSGGASFSPHRTIANAWGVSTASMGLSATATRSLTTACTTSSRRL